MSRYIIFTGLNGKSSNLYAYALNSPLILKDPTGRILLFLTPFIVRGISSGINVAYYDAFTPASERTAGGKTSENIVNTISSHHFLIKGYAGAAVSGLFLNGNQNISYN